jgi:uncharacterized cupredoxin-like copper-binding protein
MRIITTGFLTVSLLIATLPGCKQQGDQGNKSISPGLVSNPITASGKQASGTLPVMVFEQTKHDFGMMVQGEKLSYTFKFTNTGGSDLLISDASSTCGCTIPDFSKAPVKPGEQGKVEVVFNSSGKSGHVSKSVRLLTNAQPNTIELEITAEVYVPDNKK